MKNSLKVDNVGDYITESKELSSGIFWVITENSNISEYKLLLYDIPCSLDGAPTGGHSVPLNAKSGLNYNHQSTWNNEIKNNPAHKPYNKNEYNYYPRGRVEISRNRATIFLNPYINNDFIIKEIKMGFGLNSNNILKTRIIVDGSSHYECFIDKMRNHN